MPIITLELGHLDREKKAELIRSLVETASAITGIPQDAFVTLIKENDLDNIGNGTQTLAAKMGK